MVRRLTEIDLRDAVAPPLQPNLAQHRLADHFPGFCDLKIERVNGKEGFATFRRREQRRQKAVRIVPRSEEHTSELQSLMRISYAVFCLKNKKQNRNTDSTVKNTT